MSTEEKEAKKYSFFEVENMLAHMGFANRRMLIALVTVCVTFIITILVFVNGYTTREKNWLDALSKMNRPTITEVAQNGVHEQSDP